MAEDLKLFENSPAPGGGVCLGVRSHDDVAGLAKYDAGKWSAWCLRCKWRKPVSYKTEKDAKSAVRSHLRTHGSKVALLPIERIGEGREIN